MKSVFHHTIVMILALAVGFPAPCYAGDKADQLPVVPPHGKAHITLLTGRVSVVGPDGTWIHDLDQGDWIEKEKRIQTDKKSRLELTFPDETVIRFDEHTRFELVSTSENESGSQQPIHVRLISGKTWARVSDKYSKNRECYISSRKVKTHARTAIYWMDASHDAAVNIKVYSGTIKADRIIMQQPSSDTSPQTGSMASAGQDISTVEIPWSHIILPMHQIIVRPDGLATHPFRFSAKVDITEWVLWNQKLDSR